jgi:SNF2 family DNA or RNA helicase
MGEKPNTEDMVVTRTFVPHDYQLEAMQHLFALRRSALWMPMGGGKTVTTLTALDAIDVVEPVFPALVLAPLRVARTTWPDEVGKWDHLKHLRVSVIAGTPKQRERAVAKEADIYCTNYDNINWLIAQLGGEWPFKTVVADEFTRLKSYRIRQGGSRARALGQQVHGEGSRFIGLTGTPAPNGVKDLWGQIWFLDKGERLGKTFSAFEQRWFRKGYDGYSLVPYDHTQAEVEEKLKDICLTVRALPVDEPNVVPVYVDFIPSVRQLYRSMEESLFAQLAENEVEAANAAVRTQKLLQITNGAMYVDEDGKWETIHNAKLDALESIIEEANGAPVLVAYNFKHDLQRLQARFRHGRVLDADPSTVRDWNAGKVPILFAHPASAGHGLNLADGGNILAFFGVNWNLEEHMQIIERIGPMRQKQAGHDRPVLVYPILARNTVDDMVLERLSSKRSVQEVLLEAMKRRKK